MKIRLSTDEVLEIKLPEEVGLQEFQGIVMKFQAYLKNFSKFNIGENPISKGDIIIPKAVAEKSTYITQDRNKWKILRDNREAFVEVLKDYYDENPNKFKAVLEKYDISFERKDMSSNMIKIIREMHKIKPEEVGLRAFPSKNIQIIHLRLNNGEQNE